MALVAMSACHISNSNGVSLTPHTVMVREQKALPHCFVEPRRHSIALRNCRRGRLSFSSVMANSFRRFVRSLPRPTQMTEAR